MIVQCQSCHLRHDLAGRPPGTIIRCRCGSPMQLPESGGETVALTCPQCGGQADQKLARCLHCESALATVRCPSCFGLAFEGNAHCPHCGDDMSAPAAIVHDNGREPLPCPACRSDMDAIVVDKTLIDGCTQCGGVWLDHIAFERLMQRRKYGELTATLNVPNWDRNDTTPTTAPDNDTGGAYVRCPTCEHFMHRRNFAKRSGIILDVCAGHGIWFDANELARVIRHRDDPAAMQELRFPKPERQYRSKTEPVTPSTSATNGWAVTVGVLVDLLTSIF